MAIMSSPVDRDPGLEQPTVYTPRWAHRTEADPAIIAETPMVPPITPAAPPQAETVRADAAPAKSGATSAEVEPATGPTDIAAIARLEALLNEPRMATGLGGPNIEAPLPRLRPFAGDVAIKNLRRRLSLDPDLALRPPVETTRAAAAPWIGRFAAVLALAAIAAFAITLATVPSDVRINGIATVVTPLLEESPRASFQPVRLVVESQKGFTNEPLPLGVALNEGTGSEMLILVGLATGTRLTAGTPFGLTGWQLLARDLGKAYAYAPRDFVGVMDAAVDLRSPRDRLMDSQIVRLEWVQKEWVQKKEARLPPAPERNLEQPSLGQPSVGQPSAQPAKPVVEKPAIQKLEPEEIATLVHRAEDFLKIGDISAARLALRRAANSGHAAAALVLGMTFDPSFLAEQGVVGFAPEPAQARVWYQRAVELGSTEAARRLERLTVQ
jgi:hypothetical protein